MDKKLDSKINNAISGPVTATKDALLERLQSIRETPSLLSIRMMNNMRNEPEILKDFL